MVPSRLMVPSRYNLEEKETHHQLQIENYLQVASVSLFSPLVPAMTQEREDHE
jgi:hypothetical protein